MKKFHPIRRAKYRLGVYNTYKRNSALQKIMLSIILITLISSFFIFSIERKIGYLAERIAVSQLENTISQECNRTLSAIIKENNIDIDSVITIRSSEDKTNSLSADFTKINIIKTELAERMTAYLNETQNIICYIPSGALVSNNIFSGYGFDIPANLIVSGSAYADFSNSFTSAGVNQTKYTIMLKVTVFAEVHTRLNSFEKTVVTELPIADKIIVGDVPNFMVGNK